MCKRMTHAQLVRAMELAMAHPKREWAILIRFSLAWACAAARRSADMLNMVFSGLCVHDFRVTTQDEPLVCLHAQTASSLQFSDMESSNTAMVQVGVGPDPSRALAVVASQGKTLESGRCEASACVRFFHWQLCPVSAAADRVVCELSGPRLHLETLAKCHIMRAPASLGDKPMASSWFTTQVGQVLRDAGMSSRRCQSPGISRASD